MTQYANLNFWTWLQIEQLNERRAEVKAELDLIKTERNDVQRLKGKWSFDFC